jgi:hypothetical protein
MPLTVLKRSSAYLHSSTRAVRNQVLLQAQAHSILSSTLSSTSNRRRPTGGQTFMVGMIQAQHHIIGLLDRMPFITTQLQE